MQKDKDLHKLFRARLPVAILPQEFADRLTKAVLDEVAQLHLATPLASKRVDHPRADQTQLEPPAPAKEHAPFKSSTAMLLLFLFLNLQLWPFLQGCSFNPNSRLSVNLTINLQNAQQPAQKVSARGPKTAGHPFSLTRTAATNVPPLGVKPHLPIIDLSPVPHVLVPTLASTQTPTSTLDESLINQHGPPGEAQQPTDSPAVTLPQEQPSATQASPPEATVAATTIPLATATASEPNEPPAVTPVEITVEATVEVTAEITVVEPTPTAPLATPSPTPGMTIFEPTMTSTPATQEPGATATDDLTATPTSLMRPWHTSTPAMTTFPTSEATLAASTPTS